MAVIGRAHPPASEADEIDRQHQELMAIVQDLAEALHDGRDRESVSWALAALSAYTGYHFGFEERLPAAPGGPGAHERTMRHRVFVRTLNEFRLAYSTGAELTPAFVGFLTDWLEGHVAGREHRGAASLASQNVA